MQDDHKEPTLDREDSPDRLDRLDMPMLLGNYNQHFPSSYG